MHIRAEEMQKASETIPSGMMTAFLSHDSKLKTAMLAAREYCHQRCNIPDPVCTIANYLYPECKVIAGNMEVSIFIASVTLPFVTVLLMLIVLFVILVTIITQG